MRFRTLFVALLTLIAVVPFLKPGTLGGVVLQIAFSVVTLSAFYAASEEKYAKIVGAAVAIPALLMIWAGAGGIFPSIYAFGVFLMVGFLVFTMWEMLAHVLRARRATTEVVFAAISVYLLMGIVGAILFGLLDLWQPGALHLPEIEVTAFQDAEQFAAVMYFSFVTLTTLGYGDITPVSSMARSLAMVEALTGQLFLVVLVARVVGLHIAQGMPSPDQFPPKR